MLSSSIKSGGLLKGLKVIRIPDRIRNGRLKRVFDFYANVFDDYYHVAQDVIQDAKDFPRKAVIVGASLSTLFFAYKTNPSHNDFNDQLNQANVELGLVDPVIRNESSYQHVHSLNDVRNQRILRHFNLLFISFMWAQDYPSNCGLYNSQCQYLQPSYLSYITDRIVDVGLFGRWRILDYKLRGYDVNPNEWQRKETSLNHNQESSTT